MHLEAAEDGFTVRLDGRRVLVHSTRAPLFELGTAEAVVRQRKGSFKLHQKKRTRVRARGWKALTVRDDYIDLDFEGLARLSLREQGPAIHLSFSRFDSSFNRCTFRLPAEPGESIFGCGEQYSRLDLKGNRVPLWSEEQGVGRGKDLITALANLWGGAGGSWNTTYFGQPTFMSSTRLYVHVQTTAYTVMDFRRPKTTTIRTWAVPSEIVIGTGLTMAAGIGAVSALVGRQPALPSWTWDGIWLGAQGGRAAVTDKLERVLASGAKVGALWCQDWCGSRHTKFGSQVLWNWQASEELYPDLPDFVADLRRRGIRFLGYINPHLAVDTPLYRQASESGFLVRKPDGSDLVQTATYFGFGTVDLFNPEAFAWIKSIIRKNMIDTGMAGWMADFGEYLPVDAILYGNHDALLAHNEYPVLWARANAEAIAEAGATGRVVSFHRSGWAGSTAYAPAFWAGDQNVSWSLDDGLPSVVPAALSLGFSGAGIWHSDIGGYTTVAWLKRSRELLMRWVELAAFTPIMRSHEGNRPESNAQLWSDPETLAHLARMSAIWSGLAPYHEETIRAYVETGLPAIRHTWMHYEDEPELRDLPYQYLYGRDLLVAPVMQPGRDTGDAMLPNDRWVHLWTARSFAGGPVSIEAPSGYPPVFYRADSAWASLFEGLRRSVNKL